MKNKILLLLLLISLPVFSQTISENNQKLKSQVQELRELNAQRELIIKEQASEIEGLDKKIYEYDQAFKEKLDEIDKQSETIFKQDLKIKSQNKKLIIFTIFFIIMFLIKIVIMFLKWKYGIKLPYIINCIL